MIKYLTFLFVFISLQSIGQNTELILASDIWPPFTNIETKKTFATDLVKEALNRSERSVKIEISEFTDVIKGIQEEKFDGSAALWMSDERKQFLLFSEPYLYNQLILVGNKGSDVTAISLAELEDKKIAIVENYAYGTDEKTTAGIEFIDGKSDQQNLERLLSGEVDFMLVDALLIQYLLKFQVNDVTEYLEIGQNPMLIKALYFAVGKHVKDGEDIIADFNKQIHEMVEDGSYNKILELNWIKTDIDGDGQMEIVLDGNNAGKEAPRHVYIISDAPGNQSDLASNRYYVDGHTYTGWDNVPQQYKNDIIRGSQTIDGMGIKLDFK